MIDLNTYEVCTYMRIIQLPAGWLTFIPVLTWSFEMEQARHPRLADRLGSCRFLMHAALKKGKVGGIIEKKELSVV